MKSLTQHILAALAILTAAAFAQGTLTPPAAPAPTMRSLLELWNKITYVEVQSDDIFSRVADILDDTTVIKADVAALRGDTRSPISTALTVIASPGSYYLTKNLTVVSTDGIAINADNVTLDLNGFTISSTNASGSGSGIHLIGTRKNIHIKNGNINGTTNFSGGVFTGGGFNNGIFGEYCANVTVSDVRVSNVAQKGIYLYSFGSNGDIVERCSVFTCGSHGIDSEVVRGCNANYCGEIGITGNTVSDSTGYSVSIIPGDDGIRAVSIATSYGYADAGDGIRADNATNCSGYSYDGNGIAAVNVTNSYGFTSSGTYGINASGTASYCYGRSFGSISIKAAIAIGCTVGSGETVSSPSKHLGTP